MLRTAFILLAAMALSSVATFLITDPRSRANSAQEQMMREYLHTYCEEDRVHSIQWHLGESAVLSRLVIRSGIGELAVAELMKCKAGLTSLGR